MQPSSTTGLVAIRATQGLIPAAGILPLMSLQDMAGPMARTVEDAAATLELLVDPTLANKGSQNYTSGLDSDGLRGLRIGFDPAVLQSSATPLMTPSVEVQDLFTQTLNNLQQAGATTQQVELLQMLYPAIATAANSSFACMPVDFKESLNNYLSTQRPESPVKSLDDIIATRQYLPSVRSFLDNADAQTDSIATSAACQQYLADRTAAQNAIVALMDAQNLDLIVYPAANQPAFPIGNPAAGWYGFQALSSNSGLPSLTLPMGLAQKTAVPVGLVFLSRGYHEASLIKAAYAYQDQFQPRNAPPNNTP